MPGLVKPWLQRPSHLGAPQPTAVASPPKLLPNIDRFLGSANVADSDSLTDCNQVSPVHPFVEHIQTIRRRRGDVQRRCLEVEKAIHDRCQKVQTERARLLGQEADIEKRWHVYFESAELSTTQAGDDDQELGSSSGEDCASAEDLELPRRQLQQEVLQVRRQLQQEQLLRQQWKHPLQRWQQQQQQQQQQQHHPQQVLHQQQCAIGGLASVQASLQRERASVVLEWQRVGLAAAQAEEQLHEAEQAGRERASHMEFHAALTSDAHFERLMEERIQARAVDALKKMQLVEERQHDSLCQAEAAEEAQVEHITKLVQAEAAFWEQRALLAEEELGADEHDSWLREVLLAHRCRAEEHFEQALEHSSAAIEEEVRKEEGQWLAKAQAEWHLEFKEMSLQARIAERDVRLHEERMGLLYEEEANQILQQHETCEQSWLAAALAQTEGTVAARIASAQSEYRNFELELMEEATATELNEEVLARQLTHRSLQVQEASAKLPMSTDDVATRQVQQAPTSQHQFSNPHVVHNLRQREHARQIEDDIAYRMSLCHEASAAQMRIVKHRSTMQQEAFQRELQEVEASQDAAYHTIHKLTLQGEKQRQEYSDRADRMLTAIAKLEEEKIVLSGERRRMLLNRHQAGLRTPPQINNSVGSASGSKAPESPAVGFVSGRSLLGGSSARPIPVKHELSSTARSQVDKTWSTSASMTGSSGICRHTFMSSSLGQASGGASAQQRNTPPRREQEPIEQASGVRRGLLDQLESMEEVIAGPPHPPDDHAEATIHSNLDIGSIPSVYQTAIAAVQTYGWSQIHGNGPEWTALHWAASEGRADVCRLLLNAGGKPHQPDSTGRSSVDYALEHGHREVLNLLVETRDAGA
mmetsp:Transcript_125766/g.250971  ORF Transcript_125766/g.250971 Transcript_125766/m.250971 type:complete len:872 (+) Transcript_125766:192-2807(+)